MFKILLLLALLYLVYLLYRRKTKSVWIISGLLSIAVFFFFKGNAVISGISGLLAASIPIINRINLITNILSFFTKKKNDMGEDRARDILGVSKDASADEIKKAYKDLMKKNHPDNGGSKYLSSEIIKAKEILLKKVKS